MLNVQCSHWIDWTHDSLLPKKVLISDTTGGPFNSPLSATGYAGLCQVPLLAPQRLNLAVPHFAPILFELRCYGILSGCEFKGDLKPLTLKLLQIDLGSASSPARQARSCCWEKLDASATLVTSHWRASFL